MTKSTDQVMALLDRQVMHTYNRFPLVLVDGEGCRVRDSEGREYLDFAAGIAVSSLGHAHPAVAGAIRDSADGLLHTSNLYYIEAQARLAETLNRHAGTGRAFFCNSGAEANEAAIKLARRWGKDRGRPEAYEVVTAEGSFHGRTLATVAATGQEKVKRGFEPLPDGFRHVPFNDLAAMERAVTGRTAAVLLEAVQGEGGIRPADPEYLRGVAGICRERGVLFMVDEVQTGMGRTGRWFGFQHYEVQPDVITLAKALGGGVPIGACLATEEVATALKPGTHASTFGGNPFACRVALAVAETIDREGLVARSREMGELLLGRLNALRDRFPGIVEARGRGLMVGVELKTEAAPVVKRALEKGLLLTPAGTHVVRMVPPLVVGSQDVERAVEILAGCLEDR